MPYVPFKFWASFERYADSRGFSREVLHLLVRYQLMSMISPGLTDKEGLMSYALFVLNQVETKIRSRYVSDHSYAVAGIKKANPRPMWVQNDDGFDTYTLERTALGKFAYDALLEVRALNHNPAMEAVFLANVLTKAGYDLL